MAGRDQYEFGPHHSIHVGGHYIGGWAWGSKRKDQPAMSASPHGAPMRLAWLVIGVLVAADMLGSTFANGAEIAWVALGAVVLTAAAVRTARKHRAPVATSTALDVPPARHAISGDMPRAALEQRLAQTESLLAEVLLRAREHDGRPR